MTGQSKRGQTARISLAVGAAIAAAIGCGTVTKDIGENTTAAGAGGTSSAGTATTTAGNSGSATAGSSVGGSPDASSGNAGEPQGGATTAPDDSTAGGLAALAGAGAGGQPGACAKETWNADGFPICAAPCFSNFQDPQLPAQAIDGDLETRYTSGDHQVGGEELVIVFPAPVTLQGIELLAPYSVDSPAAYALELSTDGTTFQAFDPPIAGPGQELAEGQVPLEQFTLSIPFPATTMKAIKVKQTGATSGWWSVLELNVLGCSEN